MWRCDRRMASQNCPSGLTLISSPKRVCDITSTGCVSTEFDVHGVQYSHVCGRVIAYQNRVPIAFHYQSRGIDADYVHGVSLTHGQNQLPAILLPQVCGMMVYSRGGEEGGEMGRGGGGGGEEGGEMGKGRKRGEMRKGRRRGEGRRISVILPWADLIALYIASYDT